MISTLVLKAIRACNLRCSYCYYINGDTPQYGLRMSLACAATLYRTYARYLASRQGRGVLIWHGGEPLLLGRRYFQRLLDLQRAVFAPGMIDNRLQTNGALVDDAWIDFFLRNDIRVGLSLDGTREVHDRFRVDAKGRGSYDGVLEAIRRLRSRGVEAGVLSVMGATEDGRRTLCHYRDELGLAGADFLFPIRNHALARTDGVDLPAIGRFLLAAFDAWVEEKALSFDVRLFEALVRNALGVPHNYFASGAARMGDVVVVETTGELCMDTDFSQIDRFRHGREYASEYRLMDPDFSWDRLETALQRRIAEVGGNRLPSACQTCRMRSVCRGAHPASRYDDRDRSFDHPSAYCDPMYRLSERVVEFLVQHGLEEFLVDPDLRHDLRRRSRTHTPADRRPGAWSA
jgi:uncharacterized protein